MAQERVWSAVRDELASGHKRTHWMWFVGRDLRTIFGTPDDLKFRSSMTLFAIAESEFAACGDAGTASVCSLWMRTLERFSSGESDPLTLDAIARDRNVATLVEVPEVHSSDVDGSGADGGRPTW